MAERECITSVTNITLHNHLNAVRPFNLTLLLFFVLFDLVWFSHMILYAEKLELLNLGDWIARALKTGIDPLVTGRDEKEGNGPISIESCDG